MAEWILCKDKLPEKETTVLLTIQGHDMIQVRKGETLEQALERVSKYRWVTVGFLGSDGWYGPDLYPLLTKPIAWKALPEPYRD